MKIQRYKVRTIKLAYDIVILEENQKELEKIFKIVDRKLKTKFKMEMNKKKYDKNDGNKQIEARSNKHKDRKRKEIKGSEGYSVQILL